MVYFKLSIRDLAKEKNYQTSNVIEDFWMVVGVRSGFQRNYVDEIYFVFLFQ